MKVSLTKESITKIDAPLIVLPLFVAVEKSGRNTRERAGKVPILKRLAPSSREFLHSLDRALGGVLRDSLSQQGANLKIGGRLDISLPSIRTGRMARTIRVSILRAKNATRGGENLESFRRLGGDAVQSAKRLKAKRMLLCFGDKLVTNEEVIATLEGVSLANYSYDKYKGNKSSSNEQAEVLVLSSAIGSATLKQEVSRLSTASTAVHLVRDLVNAPPSDLVPADLVRIAREVSQKRGAAIKLRIFNQSALKKMGAGGILAVSRGSSTEPYLIHLSYTPKRRTKNTKTVVLIGKGVTFDSGGLSIKPGKGMEDMKCDMAGAACVIAVMKALSELPKTEMHQHEIHAIVPTTENMVSAKSVKPGDIMFALNKKSVEILNTDAEGRLILADALSYSERLKPDLIIDYATLTGAVIVALGSDYTGLFSNNENLSDFIQEHAQRTGEKIWPLPLAKEYRSQLDSPIANLKNIGNGGPGAILGALFLEEFVPKNVPWAHLDIAGPAFLEKASEYTPRGGTGYGVRMTLSMLDSLKDLELNPD